MFRFLKGMRFRLTLLILMAIIPTVGMAGYFALNWGNAILDNVRNQANLLVGGASERQIWTLEKAQVLLVDLSREIENQPERGEAECGRLLAEYSAAGGFLNLALVAEESGVICSAVPVTEAGALLAVDAVQEVFSTRAPAVGILQTDPVLGKAVLPMALPLAGPEGEPGRLIYAAIGLDNFQQIISRGGVPIAAEMVITDRVGQVLATWPVRSDLVGRPDPALDWMAAQTQEKGNFNIQGMDGISRYYAYQTLTFEGQPYLTLRGGLPVDNASLEYQQVLYTIFYALIFMVVLSFVLAWMISGRVLKRRSQPLLRAAQKIASGDLGARTPARVQPVDGLVDLEQSFNRMAEALQKREQGHVEAEEALRELNEKLEAIIRASPFAIVILDLQQHITGWSPAAEQLFGWQEGQVIGQPVSFLLMEADQVTDSLWQDILDGATIRNLEVVCQSRSAVRIPVHLSGGLLRDSRGQAAGVIFLLGDLSEQKQAVAAMTESRRTLAILMENLPGMAYSRSANSGGMVFVSPGCRELTGLPAESLTENGGAAYFDLIHPEDRAFVMSEIEAAIQQARSYRIVYRITTQNHILRWVLEQGVGVHEPNSHTQRVEGYITDITEVKLREQEMKVIGSLSAAMRSARGREEIHRIVLEQIAGHFDASGVALVLRQAEGSGSTVALGIGSLRQASGLQLVKGNGLVKRVIETGAPFVNNNLREDPTLVLHPEIAIASRAILCAPLLEREQALGCVLIVRDLDFSPDDLRLLASIGDIVATALRRVTLHEQTEKRLQQLTALRTIETAITSSLDFRFTLSILLDQVVNQLSVDAAAVWLYEREQKQLVFVGGWGFRSISMRSTPVKPGWGLPGRVAELRQPVSIPNLKEWKQSKEHIIPLESEGLVSYYGAPIVAKGQLHGVLELFQRYPIALDAEKHEFLESLLSGAAIAIDNARLLEDLQRSNAELAAAYDQTILGWSLALEMRDAETEGHTRRVADATMKLAREMKISDAEMVHVWRGAVLHDIGKMAVPDTILLKKEELTTEDWNVLRKHPLYAQSMLSGIEFLRPALEIPSFHHEHWDGNGYPLGLKGEDIPLSARIFAIIDVWDALRFDRHYRARWEEEEVLKYITGLSGKQFDPRVVEVFMGMIREEKLGPRMIEAVKA